MTTYAIFGGHLDSEIQLDGLTEAPGAAGTWTFRVQHATNAALEATEIGREQVSDTLVITMLRDLDGAVLLRYSAYDLGEFAISRDGTSITWRPGPQPWMEAVRWVLLGRVMATAMYVGGTLCLHGSAVSLNGEGICFLAPKFHGKSTLAAAMVAGGARLCTDDVLPLATSPTVRMRPGVPVLRLHEDSESAVALGGRESGRVSADVGKARLDFAGSDELVKGLQPLCAVYVLAPEMSEPSPGAAVTRERLRGFDALSAVVRHSSIAPLLSSAESGVLLTQASALVRSVPVYLLRSIRDLQRLPEVVAALHAWHAGAECCAPEVLAS